MSNGKEHNKILKIIILLFLVAVVIFSVILFILLRNSVDGKLNDIYNEDIIGEIEIMPLNVEILFTEYNGFTNQRSIYKSMNYFVTETIPKYYLEIKNLNQEEIKQYYNRNTQNIEKEIGITDENNFVKFAENIQKLTGEELSLSKYVINPNSVSRYSTYTGGVILVTYENNEKIGFYMEILNDADQTKTPIIYKAETNEELLQYEYVESGYISPIDEKIKPSGKVID